MENRVAALVRKFELYSSTPFSNNCKAVDHVLRRDRDGNINAEIEGQFVVAAKSTTSFKNSNFNHALTEVNYLGKHKSLPNISEDPRRAPNCFFGTSNCCPICKIEWGKCIDVPVNSEDRSGDQDAIHCRSSAHCSELCRRKCLLFKNDSVAHLRPVVISQHANISKTRSLAKYWSKDKYKSVSHKEEKLKSKDAYSESFYIIHTDKSSDLVQYVLDYNLENVAENTEFSDIFETSFNSQEDEINGHVNLYNNSIDALLEEED